MSDTNRLIAIAGFMVIGIFACAYLSNPRAKLIPPSEAMIDGTTTEEVFQACNRVVSVLPLDVRKRFLDIRLEYIAAYGVDRACDRMRGKTVQQVFDEYEPTGVLPVESGEVDGVEWSLYAAPKDGGESDAEDATDVIESRNHPQTAR